MQPTQRRLANAIRALAMDAVEAANSGHPGMPMGMADAATALFTRHLKFDPADPHWPDRDRFVLSAGHGSMLIYALALPDRLRSGRRSTTSSASASSAAHAPGIPRISSCRASRCTTGPLGQGVAMAVGMAIAERHLNADLRRRAGRSPDLRDRRRRLPDGRRQPRGDRPCRAPQARAADRAVGRQPHHHRRLDRSVAQRGRGRASPGGGVAHPRMRRARCRRGRRAIEEAIADPRPTPDPLPDDHRLRRPNKQGTAATTARRLAPRKLRRRGRGSGWTTRRSKFPTMCSPTWRTAGQRGAVERANWIERLEASGREGRISGTPLRARSSERWLKPYLDKLLADQKPVATRKASEMALEAINAAMPATIGGSADLTGSNNTKTKAYRAADARQLRAAATSITASASSAWRRR